MDTLTTKFIETISSPETYQDHKTLAGSIITALLAIVVRYFELRIRTRKKV